MGSLILHRELQYIQQLPQVALMGLITLRWIRAEVYMYLAAVALSTFRVAALSQQSLRANWKFYNDHGKQWWNI